MGLLESEVLKTIFEFEYKSNYSIQISFSHSNRIQIYSNKSYKTTKVLKENFYYSNIVRCYC